MIDLLNEYGARWAAYFVPALIQNTIFLALVLLVLYRLRYASARVRYAVGAVGLAKLLLPPLFPLNFGIGTAEVIRRAGGVSGAIRFAPSGPSIESPPMILSGAQLGPLGALFALWAAAVAIYITVSIISTLRLLWRLRGSERISNVDGFPASTSINVYMSERIAVPMTLGLFPRRISVPAAWDGWSDECRRMVLRHEVAHIMRNDGIVQALQIIAQAIYFFHPLVLILSRRLGEYREMACDDLSAGRGGCAGVEYSRFLVEIAESIVKTPTTCESASTLIKRKNELLNRVRYQMKGGAMLSKGKTIALLAGLLLLVLPLSWYHTSAASEEGKKARTENSRPGERSQENQKTPQPAPAAPLEPAPEAVPARPAPPREPAGGSISIEVGGGERVVVDGEAVGWTVMTEQLRKIAAVDDKKVIKLKCADDTPMEQIHRIHKVLRDSGLDRIEYRNGEGYGAPLVLPPSDLEERLGEINAIAKAVLLVAASGRVTLDGEPVGMQDLSDIVAKRLEKVPPLVVLLQTEKQTLYKDFLETLAALKKAGAQRIAIMEPASP